MNASLSTRYLKMHISLSICTSMLPLTRDGSMSYMHSLGCKCLGVCI